MIYQFSSEFIILTNVNPIKQLIINFIGLLTYGSHENICINTWNNTLYNVT